MSQPEKACPKKCVYSAALAVRKLGCLSPLRMIQIGVVALLGLTLCAGLRADTITGTIKDPSGAVVASARIEVTGRDLTTPVILTTDESGKFTAPNLSPGKYSVRVTKEGFDEIVTAVDLHGTSDLQLSLTIAAQQTSVNVTEKSSGFANSDTVYRQLRDLGLGNSYHVEKYTLNMDVGSFEFKSGTITLLNPINRFVTGAIFTGQGHFTLKPVGRLDIEEMTRRSGSATAEEDFTEVVFRFSGGVYPQFAAALGVSAQTPPEAATVFQHWKEKV